VKCKNQYSPGPSKTAENTKEIDVTIDDAKRALNEVGIGPVPCELRHCKSAIGWMVRGQGPTKIL